VGIRRLFYAQPTRVPVLGNLLSIPPSRSWLQVKAWANQYGPLHRRYCRKEESGCVDGEDCERTAKRTTHTLFKQGAIADGAGTWDLCSCHITVSRTSAWLYKLWDCQKPMCRDRLQSIFVEASCSLPLFRPIRDRNSCSLRRIYVDICHLHCV